MGVIGPFRPHKRTEEVLGGKCTFTEGNKLFEPRGLTINMGLVGTLEGKHYCALDMLF